MLNVTPERLQEQQERIAAIELAIVHQILFLHRLQRMFKQETTLYKTMTENKKVNVFCTENE